MLGATTCTRLAVDEAEDGAQHLVALDDRVERALERRRVDRLAQSGRRSAVVERLPGAI